MSYSTVAYSSSVVSRPKRASRKSVPQNFLGGAAIACLVLAFVFRNMPVGIRSGIAALAQIDVLAALAELARQRNYCRPEVVEEPVLRIAISAIGRFHMFDLARQMLRLGQDVDIFTGNPICRVDRDLRPHTRTHSFFHVLAKLRHRVQPAPKTSWWLDRDLEYFGRWLSRSVDPEATDILDGLDGPGPAAGRRSRRCRPGWC